MFVSLCVRWQIGGVRLLPGGGQERATRQFMSCFLPAFRISPDLNQRAGQFLSSRPATGGGLRAGFGATRPRWSGTAPASGTASPPGFAGSLTGTARTNIKKAPGIPARCSKGAVTYSPGFPVPSALRSLTSLFGMGRGGTSALWPPCLFPFFRRRNIPRRDVMRKDHRWKQTRSNAASYRIFRCVVFFASPPQSEGSHRKRSGN